MVGIDEVGRGCWAGPLLVVAARAHRDLPDGLTDSKLLSRNQRQNILHELILSCRFGEGWVDAEEIDKIGLAGALREGVKRALNSLQVALDEEIVLDGSVNYVESVFKNAKYLVRADLSVPVVSAASIYAKVTRDNFMMDLARKHPQYGFESHVGYGTSAHKAALERFGVVNGVHRISFRPVKMISKG